jgi:hypothetical protein
MNSDKLLSGQNPEFGGFLEKLHEYGAGSCFGCGGTVTEYRETGTGRVLNLCMTCGEVVYAPREVDGKTVKGFEPGYSDSYDVVPLF